MSLNRLRAAVAFCSAAVIGLGVCAAAWAQPSPNVDLPILDRPCQARKYTCGSEPYSLVASIKLEGRMEHKQVVAVAIVRQQNVGSKSSNGVVQCLNGSLFFSSEVGSVEDGFQVPRPHTMNLDSKSAEACH